MVQKTAPKSERTTAHQMYPSPKKGKKVPGATTIINGSLGWNKQVLMNWAKREALAGNDPDAIRDKAAQIGTLTHRLIEEYYGKTVAHIPPNPVNRDEFPPEDLETALNAFEGYLEWERSQKIEILRSEVQLGHPILMYGGTIDMLCIINGKKTMVDFKTGKGVYPDHEIQLSAYRELVLQHSEEREKWEDTPCYILHLSRETGRFTPHMYRPQDLEVPYKVFLNCLDIYYLRKKMP